MIAVIDYGINNIASVAKALKKINAEFIVTNQKKEIEDSDTIILPGVGSFLEGMNTLKSLDLNTILIREIKEKKKKFLGICLGMQMLATKGFEPEESLGLDLIGGKVEKINTGSPFIKIPHMGWNNIKIINPALFKNLNDDNFYFTHSYHFIPDDFNIVSATVTHGVEMVACLEKDNIVAVQFHPELSQQAGLTFLKNFLER